ncbi:hypothetical protein OC846_004992 [Tilletia horrida]|uniref:TAFII28-like protein domain-containing protein n=1 Tax=Tilletia horrida TaxID=155126 RepID=A0AAN6JQN1_9BASI|nr:hypothetical protein OC846_004992 [Tilletia horrida]KAK0549605.1 hypothetical protein OC845_003045 [Tilletia horrida]
MSSYPTPPPPPPPPFGGYGADPMSPPPLPPPPPPPPFSAATSSSSAAFPSPGLALPQPYQQQQATTAPDPYAIALPGSSTATYGSYSAAPPPPIAPSSSSTSSALVLPLGPPPSKRGPKATSSSTAATAAGGRGRQTKSTSVDPGQVDDELLPPPTPGAEGSVGAGTRANEEEEVEEAEADEDEDEDEVESMELRRQNMRENLPYLIEAMTPEQIDRHDAFRRYGLNRANIKKIINQVTSQSVADNVAVLAAGAAKIFIGEIVERARVVQAAQLERNGGGARGRGRRDADPGPIRPEHIQEAYRLYMLERDRPGRYPPTGGASGVGKRRRLF